MALRGSRIENFNEFLVPRGFNWILAPFLLEAVEASLYYFFENWLLKPKNHNLLKPLGTIIHQNSQFYYPSKPFSFHHFNVRHPLLDCSMTKSKYDQYFLLFPELCPKWRKRSRILSNFPYMNAQLLKGKVQLIQVLIFIISDKKVAKCPFV